MLAGVSKTFPGTQALRALNLAVAPGEVRALLGGNGSGKSTLIKILSGYHRPDPGGQVHVGGQLLEAGRPQAAHRVGARFVHQDLGLVDDCSVLDNLCLNGGFPTRWGTVRQAAARRRVADLLGRLRLDLDPRTAVRDLSAAQKTGVAVARALRGWEEGAIRLLVLDEPSATLPVAEVRVLLDMVATVAASGVGVLYVTHRLDEVFEVAAQATVLRNGQEVLTTPVAGLTRAALLHHLVGSELEELRREADAIPSRPSGPLLSVAGLGTAGVADVSFQLAGGEVVGVAGVTGSGRETLAAALFGALPRRGGQVRVGDTQVPAFRPDLAIRAGLAFMPADRKASGALLDMSARENLTLAGLARFWRAPCLRRRLETAEAARWFARFSVHPPGAYEEPLFAFSGGNQQKILLTKWLRLRPRVLLLDEPTQGVDAAAKAEIHHHLLQAAAAGSALLVSSADLDELVALCHRVLVLREGRLVATLAGAQLSVANLTREVLTAQPSWGPAPLEALGGAQ